MLQVLLSLSQKSDFNIRKTNSQRKLIILNGCKLTSVYGDNAMSNYRVSPGSSDKNVSVLNGAFMTALNAPSPFEATNVYMRFLGQYFGAKRAYIYQLNQEGTEFTCTAEWCAPGVDSMVDVTHGITMQMGAHWFSDGDPASLLVIRDIDDVKDVSPTYVALYKARGNTMQVVGKLMRGSSPLGALGFDDPDEHKLDELINLMYSICAFGTATVNAQNLLMRIRSSGVYDKLTGAGTRMGFYQKAENLPHHIPCGMAYFDIVGLQGVNDVLGHEAGDNLLIAVRQALVTEFPDDSIFRMGGDEFLIMAPGMPETAFRQACKRLRKRLDELVTYVAMGVSWAGDLNNDYDTLVRHTWMACTYDRQEWESAGGKRLEADACLLSERPTNKKDEETQFELYGLSRPNAFFHRASIWQRHITCDKLCVIAFDINYFKLYNDIFGRDAGDRMLELYAHELSILADKYHGVAGYMGGDNFCIFVPVRAQVSTSDIATIVKDTIKKHDLAEGFSPSVGIALTDDTTININILYDRALLALNEVKGSYTEHVSIYDEKHHERERENQMLLIRAQEGLVKGEFTFFLQPKVDILTNKVVSAEALVRWIHEGEVVPPYKFVGLMEDSGYIFALDRFVWESVCKWQRSLIDRGIEPVPVSVNVSRVDFHFADLADHFSDLVARYGLDPKLVGIEVTESALSKDSTNVRGVISRLQAAGFLVFMDDFGSGYSSLNMLRSVGIDVLKMDKGFIDNARMENGQDAIISSVIKMAHMMGLPVISEGVETEEQRDSLRSMDCDYVQGYYYYKPMCIEEFEKILTGNAVDHKHADDLILSIEELKKNHRC